MNKQTIRDLGDIKGKRIIVRADLNVPQNDKGKITDDNRIRESLATLVYLLKKGARVILCSHLGRPKGREEIWSLKPVAKRLQALLPHAPVGAMPGVFAPLYKVIMAKDCIGEAVEKQVEKLKNGQILLLENIRFYKQETDNDPEFTKQLAKLGDIYVNDAFGTAHRAHASTEGLAHHLPAVAGLLMEKEITILGDAIANPKRPLTVIIGGKKIADKVGVLDNLLNLADTIVIGGGMTYTFVKSQGGQIGNSIVDDNMLDYCANVIKTAKQKGVNLILCTDTTAADKFSADANTKIVDVYNIPDGWEGLDLGPKSIENIKTAISNSGTIIWCGPLGVFEFEKFSVGTREIAKAIIKTKAITIVGGGDSVSAIQKLGLADKFTHVSTGGSASLELIEGKTLPGVAALNDK
jgi:phosphoglycerate kinase